MQLHFVFWVAEIGDEFVAAFFSCRRELDADHPNQANVFERQVSKFG